MFYAGAVAFAVIALIILIPLSFDYYFNFKTRGDSIFEAQLRYFKENKVPYTIAFIALAIAGIFAYA